MLGGDHTQTQQHSVNKIEANAYKYNHNWRISSYNIKPLDLRQKTGTCNCRAAPGDNK